MPAASTPAPAGPVEDLLRRYERYLVLERGLLAQSANDYARLRPTCCKVFAVASKKRVFVSAKTAGWR